MERSTNFEYDGGAAAPHPQASPGLHLVCTPARTAAELLSSLEPEKQLLESVLAQVTSRLVELSDLNPPDEGSPLWDEGKGCADLQERLIGRVNKIVQLSLFLRNSGGPGQLCCLSQVKLPFALGRLCQDEPVSSPPCLFPAASPYGETTKQRGR